MRRALERILVAITRRIEQPVDRLLARPRVRTALRRRARRAWRGGDATLILCYGNINRSPFAAAMAGSQGHAGARSSGFYPEEGRPSPELTVACAARYGVDLSSHRSTCVSSEELARAQSIFVFDLENVARVAIRRPRALTRIHLLGALDDSPDVLIADPHGRGRRVLEEALARIATAIDRAERAA